MKPVWGWLLIHPGAKLGGAKGNLGGPGRAAAPGQRQGLRDIYVLLVNQNFYFK